MLVTAVLVPLRTTIGHILGQHPATPFLLITLGVAMSIGGATGIIINGGVAIGLARLWPPLLPGILGLVAVWATRPSADVFATVFLATQAGTLLICTWFCLRQTTGRDVAGPPGGQPGRSPAAAGRSRHLTSGGTAGEPQRPSVGALKSDMSLTHLQSLEAESIHILRVAVAESDHPVMLYSMGKDSSVMLHLALKAFYPSKPPFPLLHVDTTWKFREMYEFRDTVARDQGVELVVYQNPVCLAQGINPFTHGSAVHTHMWKTEGLKKALDEYGFDVAFGGARRDEEKSRAKERVFSVRSAQHRWDPKQQRPELWRLFNVRRSPGESIRVFPLSNWTELDIWQYIRLENIPIVPLYFAAKRPVIEREGNLIMVDDDRMPLEPGQAPVERMVRFRTLGCYPLTGAIESKADTLSGIIQEMLLTTSSERVGRVIDSDSNSSMEDKKAEGYF